MRLSPSGDGSARFPCDLTVYFALFVHYMSKGQTVLLYHTNILTRQILYNNIIIDLHRSEEFRGSIDKKIFGGYQKIINNIRYNF